LILLIAVFAAEAEERRDTLINQALQFEKDVQYEKARAVCDELLKTSMEHNDKIGVASGKLISGMLYRDGDDVDAAMKDWQSSLQLSEEIDYKKGIADALINIGRLNKDQGQYAEAMSKADRSLKLFQDLSDKKGIGQDLSLIGDIYTAQADYDKALDFFQQSLKVGEELGDLAEIGKSYIRLGTIAAAMGNDELSLEYSHKAEELFKKAGSKLDLAAVENNIANRLVKQGQVSLALDYYLKVQKIAEEVGSKRWLALPAINIGVIHENLGNYKLAMEYYQKAFELYEASGMKSTAVIALSNIAGVHALEGRYDRALDYYKQALSRHEALDQKGGAAGVRGDIAYVYEKKGEYETAFQYCLESLHQYQQFKEKEKVTELTLLLAQIQRDLKRFTDELESAQKAKQLAMEQNWNNMLWATLLEEGKAYKELAEPEKALASFKESVQVVESVRTQVPGTETAAPYFFQSMTEPYYELIQLLVAQNRINDAFKYAELSKARILLDVLESGKTHITKTMTAEEKEREKKLRSDLIILNTQLSNANPTDAVHIRMLKEKLRTARLDFESFRTNLYALHPELQIQRGEIPPADADQIVKSMGLKATILEYVVAKNETLLFVINKSPQPILEVHKIDISQKELSELTEKFRHQMAIQDLGFRSLAEQLYKLLIEPAESKLTELDSVIIIPDQQLWELPFQALENRTGQYLIEAHAVSYAPSLSALSEMVKLKQSGIPKLLALGNPLLTDQTKEWVDAMRAQDAQLPEAEKEVSELADVYGKQSKIYVGAQAREGVLKAEAGNFSVIHIAAHGIFNDVDPMYSHIALSKEEGSENEDGLLEPWEILDLDLKAEMVVLSACETARGKISTGEGIIGFAWAFFIAGSPSIVVSQWKVDSASTTLLMRDFHSIWRNSMNHQRISKAQALRNAEMKLLQNKQYRHPYYWAGFIVIGDPL